MDCKNRIFTQTQADRLLFTEPYGCRAKPVFQFFTFCFTTGKLTAEGYAAEW